MNRSIYLIIRFNHRLRQWLTKHMTPAGLCVLSCLVISGLIGFDIKRSVSYQIFALLLALLIVSFVLSRLGRYRLSALRHLPRFGTVAVPLRYRIVVHNHTRKRLSDIRLKEYFFHTFPSFQDFRNIDWKQSKAKWQQDWSGILARRRQAFSESVDVRSLLPNGETELTGEVIPLRRGLLTFQQLTLSIPDPLGLFNRCISYQMPQTVLILPKRYQLPDIQLPGSRQYQSDGLALAASVGDSEEFRALREYRPGDSVRKIHWKSWAKTGKPIIKEEQSEYSVRHALILDTFQAEGYSEVLEEAVAIAASLAYTIPTQESLLDTVFVTDTAHCFTVGRGLGQTEHLLALLASVVPCQDRPFSTLLPPVRERLSLLSGCICVFLDWDDDRKALVEQLQAANIATLVLIIEPATGLSEPPDRSCLQNEQSRLHVLQLGNIQEGLWSL